MKKNMKSVLSALTILTILSIFGGENTPPNQRQQFSYLRPITTNQKFEKITAEKRELRLLRETVKRFKREKNHAEEKCNRIKQLLLQKEIAWQLSLQQIFAALTQLNTTMDQEELKKTTALITQLFKEDPN